jgi:hypothetical protein
MTDQDPIDQLLPAGPTEEERQRDLRIAKRRELLDHVDCLIRPPAQLYRDLETAIELAADGRLRERIEVGGERLTVAETVSAWELEDLVERARQGIWGEAASEYW